MLSELTFKTSYHKGRDDLAEAFYLPCMRRSIEYDRAVGFFRSTVFLIAWPALRDFVQRHGHMRILCSQVLAKEDIQSLAEGYAARFDGYVATSLLEEVRTLLKDEEVRSPARVLAALVAGGTIDLKIVLLGEEPTPGPGGRIFHDKLGVFKDEVGNRVIFKGSMNETWQGLAGDGNLESIDIAASWMGARDLERVTTEEAYFQELWENRFPTALVRPFPEVALSELKEAADPDWESTVERLVKEIPEHGDQSRREKRSLWPHQERALASWYSNGRKGILELVTGSGKTLVGVTAIRDAVDARHEVVLVLVPNDALFTQWYDALKADITDRDVHIFRAGAGHGEWRGNLGTWSVPGDARRIILSTMRTAASDDFLAQLTVGDHLMLVADEVHRLGSTSHRRLLENGMFGARMGLSATPERAGDSEGTEALLAFFAGVLEPRYRLEDAVRDGVLTPYFYRPHIVRLSVREQEEWSRLSAEIGRLRRFSGMQDEGMGVDARLSLLYFRRAKVVKEAEAKVPLAIQLLAQEFAQGQKWIVYCEDLEQLRAVTTGLGHLGLPVMEYHSLMASGQREQTIHWLSTKGGITVSIRCLDEGVDVPTVTHALILASSKNPREYIQRRGRVLRKAPGKALSYVHDVIVVPRTDTTDPADGHDDPVAFGELSRAVQFAKYADNPASAADLETVAFEFGIDWHHIWAGGIEDDDEELQ